MAFDAVPPQPTSLRPAVAGLRRSKSFGGQGNVKALKPSKVSAGQTVFVYFCLRRPQGDGYRRLKSLSGDSARTVLTTAKKQSRL